MRSALLLIVLLAALGAGCGSTNGSYGAPFTVADPISVGDLLEDRQRLLDSTVQVTGGVTRVCQRTGCWMALESGGAVIRVRTFDHAFDIHRRGAGARATVQGRLTTISEAPVRPADLEVTEPLWELIATGVLLEPANSGG